MFYKNFEKYFKSTQKKILNKEKYKFIYLFQKIKKVRKNLFSLPGHSTFSFIIEYLFKLTVNLLFNVNQKILSKLNYFVDLNNF